jgi:uncharacterized membrane protein required for colicin V production
LLQSCLPVDFHEHWNGPGGAWGQSSAGRKTAGANIKTLIFFLVVLQAVAAVLLILGFAIDSESLRVASYALGMPVTFALLGNIGSI